MVRAKRVILQIFIIILFGINTNASVRSSLHFLSKLLGERSHDPLIILIEQSPSHDKYHLRSKNNLIQGPIDTEIDEKESLKYVNDILKSTGDANDPEVIKTNEKFKNALRSKCEQFYECEVKCEPKPKPKKKNCKKTCKEVYDYLMMCHPPGGKNKEKKKAKPKTTRKPKDSCESSSDECGEKTTFDCDDKPQGKGKTMPPKW